MMMMMMNSCNIFSISISSVSCRIVSALYVEFYLYPTVIKYSLNPLNQTRID